MHRRQLLSCAVVAGIATAGCLDADHATVQRLVLLNAREEPVTTELRIERDGPDEPLRVSARPDDCHTEVGG